MFSALHPGLLAAGLALVAVPILIHLLLRQRPRPRPWAAMRWLLAAAKAAQRRWRLTNFLLLLARCLIIAFLALAVARPTLAGLGGGSRLVIVIDRTASMGARGADPGPLAAAKAQLAQARFDYQTIAVVAVDREAEVVAEGVPMAVADALAELQPGDLPGGLDAATRGDSAARIAALCRDGADALLVSDFAQDDGAALVALLTPTCRAVSRLRVGAPTDNAAIAGVEGAGEQLPGAAGELAVRVVGRAADVALSVDDAPFVPVGAAAGASEGAVVRVPVPPLGEGPHRLRVRLDDGSLAYDNLVELPVTIRPRVEALAVQQEPDYLGAALGADDRRSFSFRAVSPAQFAAETLPPRGVVALRSPVPNAARLRDWVLAGGVLWAGLPTLRGDAALRELVPTVEAQAGGRPGGAYATGDRDVDEVLSLATRTPAPASTLPPGAEIVLRAGADPIVVAVPAGRGWVVVELADLAGDRDLQARGTTPLWVVRAARRLASRLDSPRAWTAGSPAPTAATLKRGGEALTVAAGELLLLAPGAWDADAGPVVVLPSVEEGRIDRAGGGDAHGTLERALPSSRGADLGALLAALMLLAAIGEGAFAAWAGRTYGR